MSETKAKCIYQIIDTGADKAVWRRIGTAFVNADQSLNLVMDCVPLVGKMHIRDFPARIDKADDAERREAA